MVWSVECEGGNSPQPFSSEAQCPTEMPSFILFNEEGFHDLEAGSILIFFGAVVLVLREIWNWDEKIPHKQLGNAIDLIRA